MTVHRLIRPGLPSAGTADASADVCLILEGTYPYVAGGVSTWVHDLIRAHDHLRFHLVALKPPRLELDMRYELPRNVVGLTPIVLQELPAGHRWRHGIGELLKRLHTPIGALFEQGGLPALACILKELAPCRPVLGEHLLMNSRAAWRLMLHMYQESFANNPFLDYFWSWRALLGGLYAVLLAPIPPARVYHTIATGYAGVYAARARLEMNRPVLLTEHGIYTNERRIEIAMADWLADDGAVSLDLRARRPSLKDFWISAFTGYSKVCYQACSRIITLYRGNQQFQIADGAPPERLMIIPNGVDYERFAAIAREPREGRPPRIALIGRVVPIKDVKTFVMACSLLRQHLNAFEALVLGPTDEDPRYFEEVIALLQHLRLQDEVRFPGRVRLDEYLGGIDVIVLTSVSEAQPLVILEAGAAGIPTVATDVGSCSEILLGQEDEDPALGPGGAVTRSAAPAETAQAIGRLLTDGAWYQQCSGAIRERVRRHYHQTGMRRAYAALYEQYLTMPDLDERSMEAGDGGDRFCTSGAHPAR